MSNGMNVSWERGPRETTTMRGKNKGLVVTQEVVRVHTPKATR